MNEAEKCMHTVHTLASYLLLFILHQFTFSNAPFLLFNFPLKQNKSKNTHVPDIFKTFKYIQ